jgi:hypothetical protein
MQEITDYSAHMDQRLVLLFAAVVAAVFILLIVFDNSRRRRFRARGPGRDRSSSSRPGFFKRTASSFRSLREELQRRDARKSRRHDRRK